MIVNQISSFSPSFGRAGGADYSSKPYSRTSGLNRQHNELMYNIERKIDDQTKKMDNKGNGGISRAELNKALRAQNEAIGKSLIAILDAINGIDDNAYWGLFRTFEL